MPFLNLHTHHPALAPGVFEIESVYFGQDKSPAAAWRSAGLHPWFLDHIDFQTAGQWLRGQAARPGTLAIGEAGLDKATETPWDLQRAAFQLCIAVSEQTHKPLIIHCVRAFEEILSEKNRANPAQPWVFHGFAKNENTAQMLLRAGCYCSFGAAILKENSPAAAALQNIPTDRFFLETDDRQLDIQAIYRQAALLRNTPPDELQQQIWANFQRVLGPASAIFAAKTDLL